MKGINQGGRCKCGGCGRTFSSLSTFDAHFGPPQLRGCFDPATVVDKHGTPKLKLVDGVWRSAVENPRWAADKETP
jgi:hypothetical protein